ncbi:MAG: outer membrane protein transport protein [Gammaproteobacteria bacterium]|nr:outer membrane protein transport protein [Gammaproteobacteria bacterium]
MSQSISLGVSGILNYSRLDMKGISGFAPLSVDPTNLSNNGTDDAFGFGALVSMQADLGDATTLSLAYQSKIANTFDDYSGLFVDGGELDIPPRANPGLAYKMKSGSAVTFDVERIFYEDSDSIGNPSARLFGCMSGDRSQCLGGSNGAGFGWNDMTVYKLGFQWQANPAMTCASASAPGTSLSIPRTSPSISLRLA